VPRSWRTDVEALDLAQVELGAFHTASKLYSKRWIAASRSTFDRLACAPARPALRARPCSSSGGQSVTDRLGEHLATKLLVDGRQVDDFDTVGDRAVFERFANTCQHPGGNDRRAPGQGRCLSAVPRRRVPASRRGGAARLGSNDAPHDAAAASRSRCTLSDRPRGMTGAVIVVPCPVNRASSPACPPPRDFLNPATPIPPCRIPLLIPRRPVWRTLCGTAQGHGVYKSTDAGASWQRRTPAPGVG